MDMVMTSSALFITTPPAGGGVYSVQAPNASEMERRCQTLMDFLSDIAEGAPAVGNPPTVASFIRGFTLGAAGDGASFMATVQVDVDMGRLQSGSWISQDETPVRAITGQHGNNGWSGLSFVDAQDPTDLRERLGRHSNAFWLEQKARFQVADAAALVTEIQTAGAGAGRIYMVGYLWCFDLRDL